MHKIRKNTIFLGMSLALALFNVATIRRQEDPILKTQTDSISLKQKLEETKDGVKGAPAPSFKYYDKEQFLTGSPVGTGREEKEPNLKEEKKLEEVTEVETSEVGISQPAPSKDEVPEVKDEDDWWTEDQAQEQAPK